MWIYGHEIEQTDRTISGIITFYIFLYLLNIFHNLQDLMKKVCKEVYQIYIVL